MKHTSCPSPLVQIVLEANQNSRLFRLPRLQIDKPETKELARAVSDKAHWKYCSQAHQRTERSNLCRRKRYLSPTIHCQKNTHHNHNHTNSVDSTSRSLQARYEWLRHSMECWKLPDKGFHLGHVRRRLSQCR